MCFLQVMEEFIFACVTSFLSRWTQIAQPSLLGASCTSLKDNKWVLGVIAYLPVYLIHIALEKREPLSYEHFMYTLCKYL